VSATEAAFLKPGMRVAVPFGKSKIYTGLVSAVHETPPQGYEAKDIHQILDEVPLVTALQLQLWQWISSYYMCKVGEVMKAALPSSFLLESETVVRLQPDVDVDAAALDDDAFLVYQGLHLEPEMRVRI
jgi:primosomal protein N' (replication factor Y)